MKTVLRILVLIYCVLVALPQSLSAQLVVSQVSTWKEVVDEADLSIPYEAGADLNSTIETSTNYNQLDVLGIADAQGWKVAVSRQDINWPAALTLHIKRNSNGIACGTCLGVDNGTSHTGYLQFTNIEQDFIFGTGEVSDIDLQFKIEGISLTLEAQSYTTEIVYTLYGD